MSATPTYDNVVEELRIDPERIAARPAWSFQAAERRRQHQEAPPSGTAGDPSVQEPLARQIQTRQTLSGQLPSTQTAVAT